MRQRYSSDLTDSQWQLIKPLFHWQRRRMYYCFRSWKRSGLFERLHDGLRRAARVRADRHESQQASALLKRVAGKATRLQVVLADRGYRGTLAGFVWCLFGWLWRVIEHDPNQRGFVVLKKTLGCRTHLCMV